MNPIRTVLLLLSTICILFFASPVRAAMPVIDVGAITQLIMQILTLREQLSTAQNQLGTAESQLTTAEDQLRAYTTELARQQSLRQQARDSIGSLRNLPPMGL